VPAGKRLVIETVTLGGLSSIGTDITECNVTVQPAGAPIEDSEFYHMSFERIGANATANYYAYAGTHNVRIYAEAGSLVGFHLVRSASSGFTNFRLTVSGYLVDVP